mmetsp:Transcript_115009/g.330374  ORF Transcript_115009/g.330374 Transcript_115009/m.330374 type:complete len:202 (-) Transcript_115009:1638-2243(-)
MAADPLRRRLVASHVPQRTSNERRSRRAARPSLCHDPAVAAATTDTWPPQQHWKRSASICCISVLRRAPQSRRRPPAARTRGNTSARRLHVAWQRKMTPQMAPPPRANVGLEQTVAILVQCSGDGLLEAAQGVFRVRARPVDDEPDAIVLVHPSCHILCHVYENPTTRGSAGLRRKQEAPRSQHVFFLRRHAAGGDRPTVG